MRRIRIHPVPGSSVKLFFRVLSVAGDTNHVVYSNRNCQDQVRTYDRDKDFCIDFKIDANPLIKGNVLIEFKQINFTGSTSEIFRVTFNTAFIGQRNKLKLKRNEISPENTHKDLSKFPSDFEVELIFEDACMNKNALS